MDVSDNACVLNKRATLELIMSKLAPRGSLRIRSLKHIRPFPMIAPSQTIISEKRPSERLPRQ